MFEVEGKKVLVTGSTQGIGRAIATEFAKNSAIVYVHGSRREKTEHAACDIGMGVKPVFANLSEDNCAEQLYGQTGDVDILILNASVQFRKPWKEITEEEFALQINVNFRSSLALIQKYVPYMRQNHWGRIITVGSVQQFVPHKDMLVYAASKEAQFSMVKNLAKQIASDYITVNNIAPGVIATPRNEEALNDAEYARQVMSNIPMGYAGLAEDCVGAVILLASEAGRYITGVNITIDGGMSL